jgi:prepilin-type N-terminal cleavage/methylation domain-containing protein
VVKKEGRMKKGFTLLELLIVIVIIGILAAVALPRYFANVENARKAEAVSTMRSVREGELAYYANTGAYTATLPISVDLDDDETVDVYVTASSPNFTFSVQSAGVPASAYIQAARSAATGGRRSYGMCIQSARVATCDAATCNPVCP